MAVHIAGLKRVAKDIVVLFIDVGPSEDAGIRPVLC